MAARWGWIALAYALVGAFAAAITVVWRGASPLVHSDGWLGLDLVTAHVYSLSAGLTFGALLVLMTRVSVHYFEWARQLHRALRPFCHGLSLPAVVLLALLSACGEELLFRGLLQPLMGLVPQAVVFGLLHYLPGPSRWVWVGWATAVGVALGGLFAASGSLLGPIAAHALVNGLNLAFLRSHDPAPRRSLGGLLGH